jgi:hypothetical protein
LREFFEAIGDQLLRLELNHVENIDRQLIVQANQFNIYITVYLLGNFVLK